MENFRVEVENYAESPRPCECTYEALDTPSIILQALFLGSLIPVMIIILTKAKKIRKLQKEDEEGWIFKEGYVEVYFLLFSWCAFSATKVFINILAYLKAHNEPKSNLNNYPGIFECFDSMAALCLILLLIYIPSHWIEMILATLEENANLDLNTRLNINRDFKILFCFKIYLVLRLLTLGYFVTEFFLIQTDLDANDFGCNMPSYNSYYLIAESFIMVLFYLLGNYRISSLQKRSLVNLTKDDEREIKREFHWLLLAVMFRLCYHCTWRIFSEKLFEVEDSDSKQILCFKDTDTVRITSRIILLFIDHCFMHYAPVIVILFIYRPFTKSKSSLLGDTIRGDYSEENVDSDIGSSESKEKGESD